MEAKMKGDTFKRMIANRVNQAVRWHKMRDEEQVQQFVMSDLRAKFNDDEFIEKAWPFVVEKLVESVMEADDTKIAELRKECGDKLIDAVVEAVNEAASA